MAGTIRIGAVGDIHPGEDSAGSLRPALGLSRLPSRLPVRNRIDVETHSPGATG